MESPSEHLLFIGTYTKTTSRGIYAARLDPAAGSLSAPELAVETSNPTFLAFRARKESPLCGPRFPGDGRGLRRRCPPGRLTPLAPADPTEAIAPCHVAVDRTGRALLATNFHTGIVAALPIGGDGKLGSPRSLVHQGHGLDPKRQASAHPHSSTLSPDNRFALVCDLGLDRIFTYRLDAGNAALEPGVPAFVAAAPGSGPRHFAFGADGHRAYAINEIASTIVAYDYDSTTGSLAPRQTVSTLPAGFSGQSSAAEIRLHPNGRFLYGSNRGHDSIASFTIDPATGALALLECVPCGGRAPRHFALSPDGNWLACAHQDSNSLCSFRVDPATGRLTPTGSSIAVAMPVCVVFHD